MKSVEDSSRVHKDAMIGLGTTIWNHAVVREFCVIGRDCVVGIGAYLGPGVTLGNNCRVQNFAQVFEPASLHDDVFIGPGAILTNDKLPRAVNPDGSRKQSGDWTPNGVIVQRGASIGAGVICVGPVTIGAWALVGAGAIVVKDVPSHALMAGNPARQTGWVGMAGKRLFREGKFWVCPESGELHVETIAGLKVSHSASEVACRDTVCD